VTLFSWELGGNTIETHCSYAAWSGRGDGACLVELHDNSGRSQKEYEGHKEDKELTAKVSAAIRTLLKNGEYDRIAKPYFNFDIYGLPSE